MPLTHGQAGTGSEGRRTASRVVPRSRLVPIILTTSGGAHGESSSRGAQSHWKRVEEEDEAMTRTLDRGPGCQKEEGNLVPRPDLHTVADLQLRLPNATLAWLVAHSTLPTASELSLEMGVLFVTQ